jgi:hypothetical protein
MRSTRALLNRYIHWIFIVVLLVSSQVATVVRSAAGMSQSPAGYIRIADSPAPTNNSARPASAAKPSGGGGDTYQWYCWPDGSPDPCHNTLYAVDTEGSNLAWAVGEMGTALRWDGVQWQKVETPTEKDLLDVDIMAGGAVWAVGQDGTILRGNGTQWELMTSPVTQTLKSIDMETPSIGWAVGEGGVILRWNGGVWTVQKAADGINLNAVSMLFLTDGYAVGDQGVVYHWNGSIWSFDGSYPFGYSDLIEIQARFPEEIYVSSRVLYCNLIRYNQITMQSENLGYICSVSALNRDDVWGVGLTGAYPNMEQAVLHWNGLTSDTILNPDIWPQMNAISMISDNDGWIVGTYGLITRWDGYGWNKVSDNAQLANWNGVGLSSETSGWVVGQTGRIMKWDGVRPQAVQSPTGATLNDVSALPDGQAWAVGELGTILHWNGAAWQVQSSPAVTDTLVTVQMLSSTDGWTAEGETFLHWDGLVWTKYPQLTGCYINDMVLLSPNSGWAAGNGSNGACLLRYTGGETWSMYGDGYGQAGASALSILTETDGWFVTAYAIWRWDGQNWTIFTDTLPGDTLFMSIRMASSKDGWISSSMGLLRWNGVDWLPWHGGENLVLPVIAMSSTTSGLAVSQLGSLVYEWDGVSWQNRVNHSYGFNQVDASSDQDVWITGANSGFLHFDGKEWFGVPSYRSGYANHMDALDENHAWSGMYCGASDCITFWDGKVWLGVGGNSSITDIEAVSENDVWVSGNPYLLHWDGINWQVARQFSGQPFNELEMISAADGWALGYADIYGFQPAAFHWDGTDWLTHTLAITAGLYTLATTASGEAWIGGGQYEGPSPSQIMVPKSYYWNDSDWVEAQVEGSGFIYKIDMFSATDGWAVGSGDGIWHWDGTIWKPADSPIHRPLFGLKMLASNDGWATAEGGVILRYGPPPDQLPADPQQSTITASPAQVPSDGVSQAQILVTLRGSDGAPLPGKHISLTSSRPDADLLQQPSLVTDANGQTHAAVASIQAGNSTISAMALEGGVTLAQTAAVQFISTDLNLRGAIYNFWQHSDNTYAALQKLAVDSGNLGDYLRLKLIQEDLQWYMDVASIAFSGVVFLKDMDKTAQAAEMAYPGVNNNWDAMTNLKSNFPDAGNMWNSNLKEITQNQDWSLFPDVWGNSGWQYFESDFRGQVIEDISKDLLSDFFGRLIDNSDPQYFSDLGRNYKNDLQSFRYALEGETASTLAALPTLTPQQEALYIQDIQARYMVPTDLWTNHYQVYNLVQGIHDAKEGPGGDMGQEVEKKLLFFLAKSGAKTYISQATGGSGLLIFNLSEFIVKTWTLFQQQTAIVQALGEVPALFNDLPDTAIKIYSNDTSAYRNILEQNTVAPAQAQIQSIDNYSMGHGLFGGDNFWQESESFTDIRLTNTGSEPTIYEVYGQYDYWAYVWCIPWFYIPTSTHASIKLAPGATGTTTLYYKLLETGTSPEPNSVVTIRILGTNDWGMYHITTEQVTWNNLHQIPEGSDKVAAERNPQDYALIPDGITVVPNPIDLYVGADASNPAYQAFVLVTNPFTQTILAQISYTLPAEVSVIATDGFVYTDTHTIRWSLMLDPDSSQILSFRMESSAPLGQPLLFPPAQMSFRFEDQPGTMQSQSNSVQTDGIWPLEVRTILGHAAANQPLLVSVTLTSTLSTEITGTLVITLTNGKGQPLDVQEIPFMLAGQAGSLVQTQVPGQPYGNYVVEIGVRFGQNSRRYGDMVYILREYTMFLPTLLK